MTASAIVAHTGEAVSTCAAGSSVRSETVVTELGAHARGGRQQVERLGVEQHQLLLDADREIGHAVEQGPPGVRVEHPGGRYPRLPL